MAVHRAIGKVGSAGRKAVCSVLSGQMRLNSAKPLNYDFALLDRVNDAFHTHIEGILKTGEAHGRALANEANRRTWQFNSEFRRLTFQLAKFDAPTIRNLLRRERHTDALADLGADATNDFKLGALGYTAVVNDASSWDHVLGSLGFARGSLLNQAAGIAFALGNRDRILDAVSNTVVRGKGRVWKHADRDMRQRLLRDALADMSKAQHIDVFTLDGKKFDLTGARNILDMFLRTVTPAQLDQMMLLYSEAGRLHNAMRDRWVSEFTRTASRAPTAEELFEEFGGTFGAYMPRVWFNTHTTGFTDEAIAATAGGVYDLTIHSVRTGVERDPLSQLFRKIHAADEIVTPAPIGVPGGRAVRKGLTLAGKHYEDAASAIEAIFPGWSSARKLEARDIIRHAVLSADDGMVHRAVPSWMRDPFLNHRYGAQGFNVGFRESMMAYIQAGARMTHYGPLLEESGTLHRFLKELAVADLPLARAYSNHINQLMGRNGLIDKQLVGMMHPSARLAARALFSLNPGPALMNATGVLLQGVPWALSDGLVAASKDMTMALALWRNGSFQRFFDESHLGGSFSYGYSASSEAVFDMARRLRDAAADNDLRSGFLAIKDLIGAAGEFLAIVEIGAVRPFGAALGFAKAYRRLGLERFDTLTPAQHDAILRSMIEFTDQITTFQGGVNSIPLTRYLANIPVVGQLSSMLVSTPTNLFSQFMRDVNLVVSPRTPSSLDRTQAARRLAVQATMGTMLAGPFWFLPMWREAESEEDRSAILSFATEWEKRYSLAGFLNSDLAGRLNPVHGVVERFAPDNQNPLLSFLLGPLGRPVGDLLTSTGLGADEADTDNARRRALGALGEAATGLPPSQVLPSAIQYLMPGGVAAEKALRVLLSTQPNAEGKLQAGILSVPVPTLEGNRIDAAGRPFVSTGGPMAAIRGLAVGGRQLDEAVIAAEGVRAKKRSDRRASVEQQIRRHLLDGNIDLAGRVFTQNSGLNIQITSSELEKEAINRALLPQARAVYSGQRADAMTRVVQAAQRLESGGLSEAEAKNEWHILVAGILRFQDKR